MLAAIASAAIMLDGADCWAARRQGLASALGARFDMIAVAKAATVPFRILAIGAIALSLPRGSVDRRSCAGRCRLATRRRERSSSLRASRCSSPSPRNSPGCAPGSCALALGLLAFSCAADLVILLSIPPNWVGRR